MDSFKDWYEDWYEIFWWLILIVGCILFLCVFGIVDTSATIICETKSEAKIIQLVAASDSTCISGSLSGDKNYFEGSISENSVFKYYYKASSESIKLGTIPADSTTIYITEVDEPYLKITTTNQYAFKKLDPRKKKYLYKTIVSYKMYLPEGSVIDDYVLDLN